MKGQPQGIIPILFMVELQGQSFLIALILKTNKINKIYIKISGSKLCPTYLAYY